MGQDALLSSEKMFNFVDSSHQTLKYCPAVWPSLSAHQDMHQAWEAQESTHSTASTIGPTTPQLGMVPQTNWTHALMSMNAPTTTVAALHQQHASTSQAVTNVSAQMIMMTTNL